jgi:hypothetical protein
MHMGVCKPRDTFIRNTSQARWILYCGTPFLLQTPLRARPSCVHTTDVVYKAIWVMFWAPQDYSMKKASLADDLARVALSTRGNRPERTHWATKLKEFINPQRRECTYLLPACCFNLAVSSCDLSSSANITCRTNKRHPLLRPASFVCEIPSAS